MLQKSEGFRAKTHTETYTIRRVIPPSGGVKVEIVAGYIEPLTTQDLKSYGFPVGSTHPVRTSIRISRRLYSKHPYHPHYWTQGNLRFGSGTHPLLSPHCPVG